MNIQEAVLADGMLDIGLRALRGTVERSQANRISLLAERDEVAAALASASPRRDTAGVPIAKRDARVEHRHLVAPTSNLC